MNSPRRRRASSPERPCRCAECDAVAEAAGLDPEACMLHDAEGQHPGLADQGVQLAAGQEPGVRQRGAQRRG
ncbi:MAG TPA: hypothetical protein VGI96_18840, partial [Streptosporangiaceae bacterium]